MSLPKRYRSVVAGVLAFLFAACGQSGRPTMRTVAAAAQGSAMANQPSEAAGDQAKQSERLNSTLKYDGGMEQFEPAPASLYPARRSSAAAYQIFAATGLYSWAPQYSPATVKFALYTANGASTNHVREPVWAIIFHDVPDVGSHDQSAGVGPTTPPATELHDIVIIVDDSTGQALEIMSTGKADGN